MVREDLLERQLVGWEELALVVGNLVDLLPDQGVRGEQESKPTISCLHSSNSARYSSGSASTVNSQMLRYVESDEEGAQAIDHVAFRCYGDLVIMLDHLEQVIRSFGEACGLHELIGLRAHLCHFVEGDRSMNHVVTMGPPNELPMRFAHVCEDDVRILDADSRNLAELRMIFAGISGILEGSSSILCLKGEQNVGPSFGTELAQQ